MMIASSTPPDLHLNNPPSTEEINDMKNRLSSRKAPGLDDTTHSFLQPIPAANLSPAPTVHTSTAALPTTTTAAVSGPS